MNSRRIVILAVLAASVVAVPALGYYRWMWRTEQLLWSGGVTEPKSLTDVNGAHPFAWQPYLDDDQTWRMWSVICAEFGEPYEGPRIRARELQDIYMAANGDVDVGIDNNAPDMSTNVGVDIGQGFKHAAWLRYDEWSEARYVVTGRKSLTVHDGPWDALYVHTGYPYDCYDLGITTAYQRGGDDLDYVYVVYSIDWDDGEIRRGALCCSRSINNGQSWGAEVNLTGWVEYGEYGSPSVAAEDGSSCAYMLNVNETDEYQIEFRKTANNGGLWSQPVVIGEDGSDPFIAVRGGLLFACWEQRCRIAYRYSRDGGSTWIPGQEADPAFVDLPGSALEWTYGTPKVCLYPFGGTRVFLACRVNGGDAGSNYSSVASVCGWLDGSNWVWSPRYDLATPTDRGYYSWQPDLAVHWSNEGYADSILNCTWLDGRHLQTNGYQVWRRLAHFRWDYSSVPPPGIADNTGVRLVLGEDGQPWCARGDRSQVVAGPILGTYPAPNVVDVGCRPAVAADAAGGRWIAYLRGDTVWTMLGDGSYKAVFAGDSTAVPGQPSIACYPTQANGVYVGNVVFPVYSASSSRIMYARVDTGQVVLDTIESVANLGDSLPCINIFRSDSLVVTWQHGDSVLSSLLPDYGPGTSSRPGAWSSPSVVTSHGYHPMSVFDGSVLNCVWTEASDTATYAVHRSTKDFDGMFSTWSAGSNLSGDVEDDLANPVAAGMGVVCWQAKVNGGWTIKGVVRGDTVTLVANDTDAYHPHAVAESSAVSPSIDQVRVHLLYTAGVTFEVDSGVFDTGETRYRCDSFNVSGAGANATAANNGAKLLRKPGNDSLFAVYSDEAGAVWYARSAAGDSWQRSQLAEDRDWPAIAQDSSGRRWVVLHGVDGTSSAGLVEAYYRQDTSWLGPETLYTAEPEKAIGPASVAGTSRSSPAMAYAAFKVEGNDNQYSIKVVRFSDAGIDTCTIATGADLGDPSIAVEPFGQDSDRVHVTWEDAGDVMYRMSTDGSSGGIGDNWTETANLSGTEDPSAHPYVAADRERVVVAWAEGDTADIWCAKRSTDSAYDNWENPANLSNTASHLSDYPTVALGDSIIVAWQENRSTTDDDILVSINLHDTLNIADNATNSGYPHVLFQVIDSTPYIHAVWSEEPETDYYEVGYSRCNLEQEGGGQQSTGHAQLPGRPSLAACRPNPFSNGTSIAYQLPNAGNVSLQVYDVTGRTVRTLRNGFQKPGVYTATWNGRDEHGREVPKGVYFYRLDTPGFTDVKKAVLVR